MTADETDAWAAHQYVQRMEKHLNNRLHDQDYLDLFETKKTFYENSDFDFTEYISVGGNWWPSYFTVETQDVIGLINALTRDYDIELIDLKKYNTLDVDEALRHGKQKFLISPPRGGQVFIRWSEIEHGSKWIHYQTYLAMLRHDWSNISKTFGEVFFISDTKSNPGFLYWLDGKLMRAITGYEDKFSEFGTEISGERIHFHGSQKYLGAMRAMTTDWNINPSHIRPFKPGEKAYAWLVDG